MRHNVLTLEGRRRRRLAVVAMGVPLLLSAACQGSGGGSGSGGGGGNAEQVSSKPSAKLAITPADHAGKVTPGHPVRVEVQHGTIQKVVVRAEDGGKGQGDAVRGRLDAGRTAWRSTGRLLLDTTYTVTAKAVGEDGKTASATSSFTTLEPDEVLHASIAPLDGEEVGVGMPIALYFNHEVAEDKRADVERRLRVKMSEPVEGAWHWMDGGEVHFRPRHYWPAGERVTVKTNLIGVHAGKGLWGDQSRTIQFSVGDSHISLVDAKTHTMKVYDNGHLVKQFPISAGRPSMPSNSGIHVTQTKNKQVIMDSATVGIPKGSPDYYYEKVYWDVRISNSGEFVHAAPWSVGAQGHRNVSHGCVNLSTANAKWFYHFTQRGDIVKIVNTSKELRWRNGFTDWNMSWSQWKAGSALDRSINASASSAG